MDSLLTDTVDIKSKSTPINAITGDFTKIYTIKETGVKASVQPVSLQDVIRAGRKINSLSYKCYLEPDTDIDTAAGDRIVYNGADYDIYSEQSWPGEYIKVWMEKIL